MFQLCSTRSFAPASPFTGECLDPLLAGPSGQRLPEFFAFSAAPEPLQFNLKGVLFFYASFSPCCFVVLFSGLAEASEWMETCGLGPRRL